MKAIQQTIWSPQTYKNFKQYINYFHHEDSIFRQLSICAPIVSMEKIISAKRAIQECEEGKSSLLHIGDCAQPFEHANANTLSRKINFMRQCQAILSSTKNRNVHLIGRIAGQYAKPRSTQYITVNGVQIHNYKGDNVNNFCELDRNPSVHKLFQGYQFSIQSAKFIEKSFPNLFISHEGLILPYEQAFTKKNNNKFYCQSAHMLWIGERTRQLDGAHLQFFRGLQNPIGIKISSSISQEQFLKLVKILNPKNQKGKLLAIVRMGKQKIKQNLEILINMKQKEGLNFLFVTDPMHGNTFETKKQKIKTRNLEDILLQTKYFEQKMRQQSIPFGYSLEATFQDVTQCFGLAFPQSQSELTKERYTSKCDPRLNRAQTLKFLECLSTY